MARKTAEENRRHVLDVASGLYYQRGIRAVGMDLVIKQSGVGNATVYRQFPSKDHLAAAYVQERADAWMQRMREAADRVGDPRDKIAEIFARTAEDVGRPTYRGCPMLNTHAEFPDPDHPAHRVAVEHKRQVRDWLRDLATDVGARDPRQLSDQLLVVLNGTLATASVLGAAGPTLCGPELARVLVELACDDHSKSVTRARR